MTPIDVGRHQQCRPLPLTLSTVGWYTRRPMARATPLPGRMLWRKEAHAAVAIRAAAIPGCRFSQGIRTALGCAWSRQVSNSSKLVAAGQRGSIIAASADGSQQPQRQQQPAQQQPQTMLVPQPRWLCKVELNKCRRADVQEALKERNILPSKTLPDMKKTLAAATATEKGPRPIDIERTLKWMSRAELEEELQSRGVFDYVGEKDELQEILTNLVEREWPNDRNAKRQMKQVPVSAETAAAQQRGDMSVAPTLPTNLNKLSIAELLIQLRLRGSTAARGKKADLIGQLQKLIDEAETAQQEQQEQQEQQDQQQQSQQPQQLAQPLQADQQDRNLAAGEQAPEGGDTLAPLPAAEQDQYLGMPEGYTDIYDRNLNDFSDAEIDQELARLAGDIYEGRPRADRIRHLAGMLREELVDLLTIEEVREELGKRGLVAEEAPMAARLQLVGDMEGDSERDAVRDAEQFVDQLMDHEVLEEARGRQVAVPLDSDGRAELLDDVLAELRHMYGNVNTLFIHADKQYLDEQPADAAYEEAQPSWEPPTPPEPPVTVALLVGGPGTAAARLESFRAAVGLAQALQTAPMPAVSEPPRPPLHVQLDQWMALLGDDADIDDAEMPEQLTTGGIAVTAFYVDGNSTAWPLPLARLLGSAPSDLDAQLPGEWQLQPLPSLQALADEVKASADVAWPVTHGAWGEQGQLHAVLDAAGLQFIGTPPARAADATDKLRLAERLQDLGYPVIPRTSVSAADVASDDATQALRTRLEPWLEEQELDVLLDRFYVKPARGTGSEAVCLAQGVDGVIEAAQHIFQEGTHGDQVVVEAEVGAARDDNTAGGVRFSVCVVETMAGPLALPPTEHTSYDVEVDIREAYLDLHRHIYRFQGFDPHVVELMLEALRVETAAQEDYASAIVADPLRESLPQHSARLHTPARLPPILNISVRQAAAKLFTDLGLRDYARIDGWVLLPLSTYGMDVRPQSSEEEAEAAEASLLQAAQELQDHLKEEYNADGLPVTAADSLEAARKADRLLQREAAAYEETLEQQRQEEFQQQQQQEQEIQQALMSAEAAEDEDVEAEFADAEEAGFEEEEEEEEEDGDEEEEDEDEDEEEDDDSDDDWEDVANWTPEELCRSADGTVVFSDVNLRADTSPTAVLFQQAGAVGMTQAGILRHLVNQAVMRRGLPPLPAPSPISYAEAEEAEANEEAIEVLVREDDDDPDRVEAINELLAPEPQWQPPQQAQQQQNQWQQPQQQWQSGQQWQQQQPQQQQQQQQAAPWQPDDGWGGFGDLPDISSQQQRSVPGRDAGSSEDSEWQSPATPSGLADPEVDRYQPQAAAQQQAVQEFAYPEQQTMPDYLTGLDGSGAGPAGQYGAPQAAGPGQQWQQSQPLPQQSDQGTLDGWSGEPPEQQGPQVWVLMGGEGVGRQDALAAGRSAYLALAGPAGAGASPFLLAPFASGTAEIDRRRELLRKRNQRLKIGFDEADLPPEQQLDYIRSPVAQEHRELSTAGVWWLPYGMTLAGSCEAIAEEADKLLAISTTADHVLPPNAGHQEAVRADTQRQLAQAGVEGVGALFGGPVAPPLVPRYMDLEAFVEEATVARAVVWLSIQGSGATGQLQQWLEDYHVPFVGLSATSAGTCASRWDVAERLFDLNMRGVTTAPRHRVTQDDLLPALQGEEVAAALWQHLGDKVGASGAATSTLAIRPTASLGAAGVAVLQSAEDLAWYARALAESWHRMPSDTLSTPHDPIPMPWPPVNSFILEPYINPHSIVLREGRGGAAPALRWADDSHWARVTWSLIGQRGNMRVLPPTLHAARADADGTLLEGAPEVRYTPVPEAIISGAAQQAAMRRVKDVSLQLALRSAATIHTFVQAESGDVVMVDVVPGADLTPGSVFMTQCLAHEPPLSAAHVARLLVQEAISANNKLPPPLPAPADPRDPFSDEDDREQSDSDRLEYGYDGGTPGNDQDQWQLRRDWQESDTIGQFQSVNTAAEPQASEGFNSF